MKSLLQKLERLFHFHNHAGWDPYDGLNSSFLKKLTLDCKWLRVVAIQAMKRSPVNFRSLLGVPKERNPKAIGLLAGTYLLRYKHTREVCYLTEARHLLDWLIAKCSPGYSGYAWGYNFDWQSSVFYVPKGVPTVVNTSFIANAFLDAYTATGEKNYLDVARSSCDFIINDLNHTSITQRAKSTAQSTKQSKMSDAFCYSYSPVDNTCTHNANLLAAELLARIYSLNGERILLKQAGNAIDFTLSHQNIDGSWFYGLAPPQQYIDNFHTGFLLVSLKNMIKYLNTADGGRFKRVLSNGYEYYKKTFWDNDGCPRYYSDRRYPIDLHCSAQGIITFLKLRDHDPDALPMAKKIAGWAIAHMWDEHKGYFYFQKTRYFTSKIPYLRWPNVWMYYALSMLDSIR